MEQAKGRPEKMQYILEEMNGVLRTLGIDDFRVESISCESTDGGERQWVISLVSAADHAMTHSLQWSAGAE
jgi:hypothetical protein